MDVPAVDLTPPAVAHFDLAVAGRGAVADHEMVGEPVSHSSNIAVVIIERSGVTLSRAAVVHDNELPASSFHGRAADLFDDRPRKIAITFA